MIPTDRLDVYEAALLELRKFSAGSGARGRFIALYLGLRLLGDAIAPLGSGRYSQTSEIESFMDTMWTKIHRDGPNNVLTAPFGGGGPQGGYSTRTGIVAPNNKYPTNTWRNNLNSQKGVGCVAMPDEIGRLIVREDPRAACDHFAFDGSEFFCELSGARYRGEKHSIWLRRSPEGFQVVDLDEYSAFEPYLRPSGMRIPVYALIAVLYSFAPNEAYPIRRQVSVPEFASDFAFDESVVRTTFDCDPSSPSNARVLAEIARTPVQAVSTVEEYVSTARTLQLQDESLPTLREEIALNTGVKGELLVADKIQRSGCVVFYTGNQDRLGYDLRAESAQSTWYVEVKSSTGYVSPVMTESEWRAAAHLGSSYILALVDFVNSDAPEIRFVTDPAGKIVPKVTTTLTYRLSPSTWSHLAFENLPEILN